MSQMGCTHSCVHTPFSLSSSPVISHTRQGSRNMLTRHSECGGPIGLKPYRRAHRLAAQPKAKMLLNSCHVAHERLSLRTTARHLSLAVLALAVLAEAEAEAEGSEDLGLHQPAEVAEGDGRVWMLAAERLAPPLQRLA